MEYMMAIKLNRDCMGQIYERNTQMENLNSKTILSISQNVMSAYKDIKLKWNPHIRSKENITNNGICKAIKTVVIYPKRLVK